MFCLQLKGDAEAFAIEAKAKAEAEQMARKADAWKDYQEAAMVDMVLETIPKVRAYCQVATQIWDLQRASVQSKVNSVLRVCFRTRGVSTRRKLSTTGPRASQTVC